MLVDLASRGEITALLTVPLLNQYEDVLFRPENRLEGWRDEDLHALIDSLLVPSEWVDTHFSYRPALNDEGDELVLEAAINGRGDIVTFNVKDFKPASRFGVRVFQPRDILKKLFEGGLAYGTE